MAERVQAHRAEVEVPVGSCAVDGVGAVVVGVDRAGGMIQFEAVVEASADTAGQGGERHQSGHRRRDEGDGEQRQRPEYRRHLGWSGDAASARRQQATVDGGGLARVVDAADAGAWRSRARGRSSRGRCGGVVLVRDDRGIVEALLQDCAGEGGRGGRRCEAVGRRVWERSHALTPLFTVATRERKI